MLLEGLDPEGKRIPVRVDEEGRVIVVVQTEEGG